MNLTLLLLIEVALLIIAIQDFKTRSVLWFLFPLGYVLCLFRSNLYIPFKELSIYLMINTTIILFLILILLFYLCIRYGKKGLILSRFLGAGDILFFLLASVCFSPFNFIIFSLISFLLALLFNVLIFSKKVTVALAGWQSVFLGFVLFLEYFSIIHLYSESWIFKLCFKFLPI